MKARKEARTQAVERAPVAPAPPPASSQDVYDDEEPTVPRSRATISDHRQLVTENKLENDDRDADDGDTDVDGDTIPLTDDDPTEPALVDDDKLLRGICMIRPK